MVTPFEPSVNPFSRAIVWAVVNALFPTFSGMNTAPASAAASAAFWARVAICCQRLYSSASPANAVSVDEREREPHHEEALLLRVPASGRVRRIGSARQGHSWVGAGSSRNTAWSVRVMVAPNSLVRNLWFNFT